MLGIRERRHSLFTRGNFFLPLTSWSRKAGEGTVQFGKGLIELGKGAIGIPLVGKFGGTGWIIASSCAAHYQFQRLCSSGGQCM
jgi:hypothetical protein